MEKHSDNGQELNYTFDLKKSLRAIVRFALTGTRNIPEAGELAILRCVKGKTPKDKLSREDLPTEQDVQKLLAACADSPRDKALLAVHNEAGTRIGEILTMKIKHIKLDGYGANLLVDGKTGARKVRIVNSVPYITKWINVHPMNDDPEAPLWIYISNANSFGKPMTYAGFNNILRKRVKQAVDAKYCEICSRPLDVIESMKMEKENEERTRDLIMEMMRKEHAKKSTDKISKQKDSTIKEQDQRIKQLEQMIQKITNN